MNSIFHRLMIATACCFISSSVIASPPMDSVTKQELHDWAAIYWQWFDTGQVPADASTFTFSHPEQISDGYRPFNDALWIFADLYAHRLTLDLEPWREGAYGVEDLIIDDPVVREQFKHYTMTGEILTDGYSDLALHANHALAAAGALVGSEGYSADTITNFDPTLVVSNGLQKNSLPPGDPGAPVIPNPDCAGEGMVGGDAAFQAAVALCKQTEVYQAIFATIHACGGCEPSIFLNSPW